MIIEVGLYRFQLRTIPVLVTLVAFVILARLGMWQLERGWFKEQRLQQIADFKQVDKITFASLLKIIEQSDSLVLIQSETFLHMVSRLYYQMISMEEFCNGQLLI